MDKRMDRVRTARVLAREPNIFVATGPSAFNDAFVSFHRPHATRDGGAPRPRLIGPDASFRVHLLRENIQKSRKK